MNADKWSQPTQAVAILAPAAPLPAVASVAQYGSTFVLESDVTSAKYRSGYSWEAAAAAAAVPAPAAAGAGAGAGAGAAS